MCAWLCHFLGTVFVPRTQSFPEEILNQWSLEIVSVVILPSNLSRGRLRDRQVSCIPMLSSFEVQPLATGPCIFDNSTN